MVERANKITEAQVKAAWNLISDEHNDWGALSLDERADFTRFAQAIEAALSAFDKERQTPEGWQQIIEQAEHVALGIDCRGPDVTSATSVLIELIRAEADRLLQSTEGQ